MIEMIHFSRPVLRRETLNIFSQALEVYRDKLHHEVETYKSSNTKQPTTNYQTPIHDTKQQTTHTKYPTPFHTPHPTHTTHHTPHTTHKTQNTKHHTPNTKYPRRSNRRWRCTATSCTTRCRP
jgi:hypothetical protein